MEAAIHTTDSPHRGTPAADVAGVPTHGASRAVHVDVSAYTLRAARIGAAAGAAGIGLVRTEMMFVGRPDEPSIAEQASAYGALLASFPGRPVVLRVWDIGSDKLLPFAPAATGPNPALGQRGIRHLRRDPALLDRQLAAIVEAAAATSTAPAVMAPMISVPQESAWFAERTRRHGIGQPGAMIEVPSAAVLAADIMSTVDFVSIGTNDLLQYAFATDRDAAGPAAELINPWQPGLLRIVAHVLDAARRCGHPVSVCGEAAADPLFAAVLAGAGVTRLSVRPDAVTAVRTALQEAGTNGCGHAYTAAAAQHDPHAAQAAAFAALAADR